MSQPSQPASRPYFIGVAGGSASGKTTLANGLADLLTDLRPVVLHMDQYFRDWSEFDPDERERRRTANRPEAVAWPALIEHVRQLLDNQAVQHPVPGTRRGARGSPPETVEPGEILIVEGLFALWEESFRPLMDLKIFMEVDDDERVLRRLSRDIVERGGTVPSVIAWYRRDVWPNYPKYTAVGRRVADFVVPNNFSCQTAIQVLAAGVREQVRARRAQEAI
jgi:uridine kinase